jgi:GT2 family glycosyltransferase
VTRASIIIPAWNGTAWIADCLQVIDAQRRTDDQVIVVDNGSTDGTPDLVARSFPWACLIRLERNLGFAGGVNRGLEVAQGDLLILINQDVVLREGCLDALRHRLEENGPGIVGGKLLYPDGQTIQHAGGVVLYPRGEPDHRGYRQKDDGRWDSTAQVDYVTGAVFAFDRMVLSVVGYLDEGFYPAYYEETDYCFRAHAAGFAVIYEPRAVALHYESQSHDIHSVAYHQAMQRGRLRFILKNYDRRQLADFFPAEKDFIQSLPALTARQVMASAYLHTLLHMPAEIFAVEEPGAPNAGQLVYNGLMSELLERLSELYCLALHSLSTREASMNGERQPIELPEIHEHDFRSNVPMFGPIIQLVRRTLYQLTAKWGVAVVIDQQNRINQAIAQYLMEYKKQLQEYDARLIEQDRDLAYLSRTIAELELRQRHLVKSLPPQSHSEPQPPLTLPVVD